MLELKKLHFFAKFIFLEVMGCVTFEGTYIHPDFDFIFRRECLGHYNTLSQINDFCCLITILQPKFFLVFLVGSSFMLLILPQYAHGFGQQSQTTEDLKISTHCWRVRWLCYEIVFISITCLARSIGLLLK